MFGSHEGSVATIGERRDDESGGVSQVFEAVADDGVDHFDPHDFFLLVFFPVVSELGNPLEIVHIPAITFFEIHDDVSGVDVEDDKGPEGHTD